MDPEIVDLLRQVEAARAAGRSTQEINSRLQEKTEFSSVTALRAAAEQAQGGGVPGGTPGATARSVARGLAGGFSDELAGLAAGAGAAVVPGGEGFSEARHRVQEEARGRRVADRREAGGFLSGAGEIVGSIFPGARIFQGVRAATRMGPAASGIAAGAAEGGILGAGTGENLRERAEGAAIGAGAGAAAGGLLGGTGGLAVQGRRASKMKPRAGARLGEQAREASGLSGRASNVRRGVKEGKREARTLVEPLEQLGREEIPTEIGEAVMRNPVLREEAERVAPQVVAAADEGGESVARFTFDELDTIARSIRNDASAFQQAAGSDLPANVRPVNVKRAEEALDQLDDVMAEHLDDFPEFRARWAELKETGRALTEGRKNWGRTADDFVSGFEELSDASEAARRSYREGGATELVAWLERLSEPKAALRRIVNSPQTRQKLEIIMGPDGLEDFTRAAQDEQALRDLAHDYEAVLRFVRRYVPGGFALEGGRRALSNGGGILGEEQ